MYKNRVAAGEAGVLSALVRVILSRETELQDQGLAAILAVCLDNVDNCRCVACVHCACMYVCM
jgi:hypothetical protein